MQYQDYQLGSVQQINRLSVILSRLLLLDVFIEPGHGLCECLLLGVSLPWLRQIASHSEAVLDVREHIDLVGDLLLIQNLFTFVTLGRSKDKVTD